MNYPITIDERTIGYRKMAGTDWPVVRQLQKCGARRWIIVDVCNGNAEQTGPTFRRLADARAWFGWRAGPDTPAR